MMFTLSLNKKKILRSAIAEIAGMKLPRHLAPDALHGVVHRFRGPRNRFGHFPRGQAIQIVPQNLRLKLGQLPAKTAQSGLGSLAADDKVLRIHLGHRRRAEERVMTVKEGYLKRNPFTLIKPMSTYNTTSFVWTLEFLMSYFHENLMQDFNL